MKERTHFSVSIDSELLKQFDSLCGQRGYQTRSEAVRDLLRNMLMEEEWGDCTQNIAATLTLVCDHRKNAFVQKVIMAHQNAYRLVIVSQYILFDTSNGLKVLVLRGSVSELQTLAECLIAAKGIKYGKLFLATTEAKLSQEVSVSQLQNINNQCV